ncbi:MAG: prolipoprotein diacylglyceryl transferase [Bacteroidota bacterium]|nr:prolipoprotein diacylglyceryl transferase [Candidatus Kapabacteria bacterium]MDW8074491.1 prolipoprotein diacylglyceryl transferase [Bacteroidota bacterium]
MRPILFYIGPFPVYGFGLMVAIAFIVANWLFTRRARQLGWTERFVSGVTLLALIGGIAGAKLFHILEYPETFLQSPLHAIFSGEGLTFHGGLIVATILIFLYTRREGVKFLKLADTLAPALILAYGIGRIGCQLAGDGDYGIPSKLPWAMSYPNGTVPTLAHINIELRNKYMEMFPGEPVPYDIKVHPTPVYEAIASVLIFFVLLRLQKKSESKTGWLFGWYLTLAGIERFFIEFIRLNPLYWGLSQAQWVSLGMIIGGTTLLAYVQFHLKR